MSDQNKRERPLHPDFDDAFRARVEKRIEEQKRERERQGKDPGYLPLEREWDMDVTVWELLRNDMRDKHQEWLRQGEASDAPPLFLETMHRLYGKYFGEGAAPAYETYWAFMRLRGNGSMEVACFLACMMALAKQNGDDQHLAFIEKEYKRVMSRPYFIY